MTHPKQISFTEITHEIDHVRPPLTPAQQARLMQLAREWAREVEREMWARFWSSYMQPPSPALKDAEPTPFGIVSRYTCS